MVQIGSIVSVGGGVGGGGGGTTSGIISINGATGPAVVLAGVSGISVVPSGNTILIGGEGVQGQAVTTIPVSPVFSFRANFTAVTDITLQHNFATSGVITQIYDDSLPPREIFADNISIVDGDNVRVQFNVPQTGFAVIHGPSGVTSLSLLVGGGGADGSGLNAINGDTGPNIDFKGVNGIAVSNPTPGLILIDGVALSGVGTGAGGAGGDVVVAQRTFPFVGISSGLFAHNFNTRDVQVQVIDDSLPPRQIIPDNIIYETLDAVAVSFNSLRTGTVIIHGPSGLSVPTPLSNLQFAQSFVNVQSVLVNHNLGTTDALVQVQDDSSPPNLIVPDRVRYDNDDNISVFFNSQRSGRVVVIGSGISCSISQNQIVDSRRYALLVS